MLRVWIDKLIYGLLILCVGSVGTLTYFDAFASDHTHPYHLTVLEVPSHTHNPLPLPTESSSQLLEQRLLSQLTSHPILIASQTIIPGQIFFSELGFSNHYLLTESPIYLCHCPSLADRVFASSLAENSALLLPPDKPPTV